MNVASQDTVFINFKYQRLQVAQLIRYIQVLCPVHMNQILIRQESELDQLIEEKNIPIKETENVWVVYHRKSFSHCV